MDMEIHGDAMIMIPKKICKSCQGWVVVVVPGFLEVEI